MLTGRCGRRRPLADPALPALGAGTRPRPDPRRRQPGGRAWAELLDTSDEFRLYQPPELDILAFWPRPGSPSCAAVDAASAALLQAAMADPSPVYLSTLRLDAARLRHRDPALAPDTAEARVLRSVLMKPEHEGYVDTLHRELVRISGDQQLAEQHARHGERDQQRSVSGPGGCGGAGPGR